MYRLANPFAILLALATALVGGCSAGGAGSDTRDGAQAAAFVFPYFQSNGESGIFLAISHDGMAFDGVNGNAPIIPAPDWPGENLTRDPSILYRDGVFHMVWTTGWWTRSIGYASSTDLVNWSRPRRIEIWAGADESVRSGVKNTWAPELHWDPQKREFFILFSSTLESELFDGDRSADAHDLDHRIYVTRTRDFEQFTRPELFFSPSPEHGVIDAQVAPDEGGTPADAADDRWVMVIKNEMPPEAAGKNLRLAFAEHGQGPYSPVLGPPIVGEGTDIVPRMAEGPSLLRVDGLWWLYWDAPGHSYCLATSPDLKRWTNRTAEVRMPVEHPRHGSVLRVPASAVGWLGPGGSTLWR